VARANNAEPGVIDGYFKQSLKEAGDFVPARDAYVSWLLEAERFEQATQIVQNAVSANPNDPATWKLLVQAEAAQQRYLSALKLGQDAKRKFPENSDIRMELAAIYRLRGQENEADQELSSLINDQPKNEAAYEALINGMLLRSRRTSGGSGASGQNSAVTVLAKMNRELPDSRYAQIHSAVIVARGGSYEEAELMLRRLQAATPEDPDVLIPLAQIRQLRGHAAEGITILESAIKAHPDPDLVRALAVTKRMMEATPDVEAYVVVYASELSAQEKTAEGIAVLQAGTKKFPRSEAMALALARMQSQKDDDAGAAQSLAAFIRSNGETTERLYNLSHFYSAAGNEEASTAALERILAIMPDHVGANNDLGYFWVDEGIKLPEAEKMILKAIENEPNNSAFLDSLGWLYYKQGKFEQAVTALNKAISIPGGIEPEVLQHVGDAMYRTGKRQEAVERWRQAYDMLAGVEESKLSAREKKQKEYLNKAIGSDSRGAQPELTPVAVQRAGPATMPAAGEEGTKAAAGTMPR
jgi:tetratricopeptide (TPR) repeat protein